VCRNAPLTAEGRRRLVARVLEAGRPQAHVAAESRLARAGRRAIPLRLDVHPGDGLLTALGEAGFPVAD